jgi:nonribosomal peptide synthetase DhbF
VLGHALATRLRTLGEPVAALVMLDAFPGESLKSDEDSDEQEFITALLGIAGADGSGDPPTFELAAQALREHGAALGALDRHQLAAMHRVFRNHARIGERHTPARYDGDVVFFRAALDGDQEYADTAAWDPYVAGNFEIHEISCHHYEMAQPGPIDKVGQTLADVFRRGTPTSHEMRSTA